MADARKNTLLYHFNATNVVKKIQQILNCKPKNCEDNAIESQFSFTSEEIHKVYQTKYSKPKRIVIYNSQ